MTPARADLPIYRWQENDIGIPFRGVDMTDAPASLEVRVKRDEPGAPLLRLVNAVGVQGLSWSVVMIDNVTISTLRILIAESTIEAMLPYPANGREPNDNVVLEYALHITKPPELKKKRWLEGRFIIIPGANHD